MAVDYNRQYVGARYVPKLFDNGNGGMEWKENTYYEPLTIVTYNNSSYISRTPVSAQVGNPAHNNKYWAHSGNYNAYIGELEKRIESLHVISTPEMYGAVGNGLADDTAAIVQCLNDGNYIKVLRRGATYKVNFLGEITNTSFMLLGNGATLSLINGNSVTILYIVGWNTDVRDISIYDLTFDGNKGTTASQFPVIRLASGNGHICENITLERCKIINSQGYGIGVYNDLSNPGIMKDINISHCKIHDVGGVGIATTNAQVRYCYNEIDKTGAEGITLDNNSYESVIEGNIISHYGHGGGIGIDGANNCVVTSNMVDGTDNTALPDYQNGISINTGFADSQNLMIIGNELVNNNIGISFGTPNHVGLNVVKSGSICGNDLKNNVSSIKFMWIGADTSCSIKGNSTGKITTGNVDGLAISKGIDTDILLDITPNIRPSEGITLTNTTAYIKDKVLYLYTTFTVPAGREGFKSVASVDVKTNNLSLNVFTKASPPAYKDVTFINGVISAYVTSGEAAYTAFLELSTPIF